jgi:hypothetical protein
LSLAFVPWSRYSGVAHSSRLYWKSIPDEKGIRTSIALRSSTFSSSHFSWKSSDSCRWRSFHLFSVSVSSNGNGNWTQSGPPPLPTYCTVSPLCSTCETLNWVVVV